MRRISTAFALALVVLMLAATAAMGASNPNKDKCKDGGYATYGFKNQGQCVSYVNANGDVPSSGGGAT